PTLEVRQWRTDRRMRLCAGDGVADGAATAQEKTLAIDERRIRRWRVRLRCRSKPGLELWTRLGDNIECHQCVLEAAKLRALPAIDTRGVGGEPLRPDVSGDEIALAVEVRHPEAVNDVGRPELELNWF